MHGPREIGDALSERRERWGLTTRQLASRWLPPDALAIAERAIDELRQMPGTRPWNGQQTFIEDVTIGHIIRARGRRADGGLVTLEDLGDAGLSDAVMACVGALERAHAMSAAERYARIDRAFDAAKLAYIAHWLGANPPPMTPEARAETKHFVSALTWDLPNPFGLWLLERLAGAAGMRREEAIGDDPD